MLLGINLLLLLKVNAARHNLQLLVNANAVEEDAEGVECLPNATIFEELIRMGYEKLFQKLTFYKAFFSPQWKFLIYTILQCLSAKTTAWNEFSSTMAFVIICLATNQKFNFSKYIFESMVKNLDNIGKFLMYPRFILVFLDNQLEEMAAHNRIYFIPSHTKKIFANMRRQGKDFSGRVTPLFPTMVVQALEEMGEGLAMPTNPRHTPIITQPSSSQPQRKQESKRPKRKDTEIPQSIVPSDPTNVAGEAVNEEPSMQLKELMDFCTKLQQRVLDLENIKTAQAQEITNLKKSVKKLEKKGGSRTHKLKRLYRVARSRRVVSSKEESLDEDMFGVNDLEGDEIVVEREVADKDVDLSVDEVTLAQALVALKSAKVKEKGDVIKEPSVPVSATSTKVSTVLPKIVATTITTVSSRPRAKGIVFHEQEQEQDPSPTPIVSSQQPTHVKDKGKGKMVKKEPVKKMSKKELLKLDEELAFKLQAEEDEEERLAREKAQKVEEANIALNDIQAKVEADYQLAQRLQAQEQEELSDAEKATFSKKQKVDDDKETEELKKCMEIISDDGDDVTIEATPLSTKSPTITMFEHHLEDSVWKNQQGLVKVLNWKLYVSCGVHCVTIQNILYYLLVEKMYPLTKYTLHQMFNDVKLQVDYDSEMAFELLILVHTLRGGETDQGPNNIKDGIEA
ncbi:hypothetical protein Tco_1364718 [Tanacetum coccineum]